MMKTKVSYLEKEMIVFENPKEIHIKISVHRKSTKNRIFF